MTTIEEKGITVRLWMLLVKAKLASAVQCIDLTQQ